MAKVLVANGATIDQADKKGWTPLLHACVHNRAAFAKVLLQCRANADLSPPSGWCPLLVVSFLGLESCLSLLLAYGAARDLLSRRQLVFPGVSEGDPNRGIVVPAGNSAEQIALDRGHAGCAALLRGWPALRNQIAVKLCLDRMKREGMYEVVAATPVNELSRPLFAFKVVEMMKSCGMEPLAEDVIEYVGTNNSLTASSE